MTEKPGNKRKTERLLRLYDELDDVSASTVLGRWGRLAIFAAVAIFFGLRSFSMVPLLLLPVGIVLLPIAGVVAVRWLWRQYRIGVLRRSIDRVELAFPAENGR